MLHYLACRILFNLYIFHIPDDEKTGTCSMQIN
jgi:hypothetical protein